MAGVPQNAKQIWTYLVGQGLSANAAAGILGNIEQESGGDPQAGFLYSGYGLIQWTPGSRYFPNGQVGIDQQLPAIISYINANGSIADINANASSPEAAALYFSEKYERPNAAEANNANRQQSAALVLQASKNGWPAASSTSSSSSSTTSADEVSQLGSSIGSSLGDAKTLFTDAAKFIDFFVKLTEPGQLWRSVFVLVFVVSGAFSARLYVTSDKNRAGSAFPASILLAVVAVMAAYMAFRPWPQSSSGKAYRPGPYAVDIIKGEPPTGPPPTDDTNAIAAGLAALAGIWALGKASGALGSASKSASGLLSSIGRALKKVFSTAEKGAEDIPPEVP